MSYSVIIFTVLAMFYLFVAIYNVHRHGSSADKVFVDLGISFMLSLWAMFTYLVWRGVI